MFPVLLRTVALCALGAMLQAQTVLDVPSSYFNFYSFSAVSPVVPTPPVQFQLAFPTQSAGAQRTPTACGTYSNLKYNHYSGSNGPLVGPVFAYFSNFYESTNGVTETGVNGISTQASFLGVLGSNSSPSTQTFIQSIYMSTDQCYEYGPEFGFYRLLQNPGNTTEQNTIYFYYGVNVNCVAGSCRDKVTGASLSVTYTPTGITNASGTNSHGGSDWLYQAYLTSSNNFHVRIRDPYTLSDAVTPVDVTIPGGDQFAPTAAAMYAGGGPAWYATMTQQRNSVVGGITDSSSNHLLLPVTTISKVASPNASSISVQAVDVTSTQVAISYPVSTPTTSCTVTGFNLTDGSPINDLDPTLFTGAATDTSRTIANGFRWPTYTASGLRTIWIGQHDVQDALGLDGRRYSLGLTANSNYKFTVTCGSTSGSVKVRTRNIQQGSNYPELPIITNPGYIPQPTVNYAATYPRYVDSMSGASLSLMSRPSDVLNSGAPTNAVFTYALDRTGSAWTAPNNALTNQVAGTLASTSTANAPLFLAWPNITPGCCGITLNDVKVTLYGRGSSGGENVSMCLSKDSGQTCATQAFTTTLTTSAAVQGAAPPGYPSSAFPTSLFSGWGALSGPFGTYDIRNATYTGVSTSGNTATLFSSGYPPDSVGWNTDRPPGSKFKLSGCTGGADGTFTVGALGTPQSAAVITAVESLGTRTGCTYQDQGVGVMITYTGGGTAANISANFSVSWGSSAYGGSNPERNICSATKVTDIAIDCDGKVQNPNISGTLCQYSESGSGAVEVYLAQDNGRVCLQSILYNPATSGTMQGMGSPWTDAKTFLSFTAFNLHVWKNVFTGTDYTEYVPGQTLPPATDHFSHTDVTAASTPLATQLQSYANGNGVPKQAYNSGLFSAIGVSGVVGGGIINTSVAGGGDAPCLKIISDQSGNLLQAVDSWSIYPLRGTGCHSSPTGVGTHYRLGGNPLNHSSTGVQLGGPFNLPTYFINKNGTPLTFTLPTVAITTGNPTTLTFSTPTDLPVSSLYAPGAYITCSGVTGGLAALNGTFHIVMSTQSVGTVAVSTTAGSGTLTCTTAAPLLNTTVASVTGSTTARVTVGTPAGYLLFNPSGAHHLTDGQSVVFYGLSQTTPYFAKASCGGCSATQFDVYTDAALTTPASQATIAAAGWVSQADVCPTTDSIPGPIYFDTGHGGGIVRCATIRFASQPCSEFATTAEKAAYPCATNAQFSTLKNLQPGDAIYDGTHTSADPGQNHETMLVLSVTGSPPTMDAVVMRWYGNDTGWAHDRHAGPNYDSYCCEHGPGWQPIWYETIPTGYFDFTDSTNSLTPENPLIATAHGDLGPTNTGVSQAAPATGNYNDLFGSFSAVLAATPFTFGGNFGFWAGDTTDTLSGDVIQTYPAHRQGTACTGLSSTQCPEQIWKTDANAMNPSFGGAQGNATNSNFSRTMTLVSGQSYTYKITVPAGTFNLKILPYLMSVGRGMLQDISSATTGNVMTDSQNGKWCAALRVNECRTGSSVGDVFFTWRGSWDPPSSQCFSNTQNISVPCLWPMWTNPGWYSQIKQYGPFGGPEIRRITQAWNPIVGQFTFSSMSPTSDGTSGVIAANPVNMNPQGDASGVQAWNVRLPPWAPDDNVNRLTFVQVPVQLNGVSGDTVRIQFGYAENGDPSLGYCTTRAEACWTSSTATAANPFVFAGETQHKTTCGSGCTVSIPAIPGRWLFYRVERTASTGNIVLGGTQWVVVR